MTTVYLLAALGAVIGAVWGVVCAARGHRSAAVVGGLVGWAAMLILYQLWAIAVRVFGIEPEAERAILTGAVALAACAGLIAVGGWLAARAGRTGRVVFVLAAASFAVGAGVYLLCWGAAR